MQRRCATPLTVRRHDYLGPFPRIRATARLLAGDDSFLRKRICDSHARKGEV
jgi:hypothetical protein